MSEEDSIETEVEEPSSKDPEFGPLCDQLQARCKAAGIKMEILEFDPNDKYVKVYFPAGRQTEAIPLFDAERIQALLELEFEKYVLLGDYAAICSYEEGIIEAGLSINSPIALNHMFRRLAGLPLDPSQSRNELPPLEIKNPAGPEKVTFGQAKWSLGLLTGGNLRIRPTLKIEGVQISRHDDALELLERVSNSFFFQVDLLMDVPITLARRRRALRTAYRRGPRAFKELEFPKAEYDRDPISLYWYARSARGMPLLQFLAYYQTIEFYFPTYSQAEARRKIRNILKSPAFRPERDADVARILVAARLSGSGFGEERAQLRATLNECLEPGALRAFLTESDERVKFFSAKTDKLTDQRIPIKNPDADLRNEVADRIYDIRCKIVHTKSGRDGEVELLLPFSKEAELLYPDIELIQFVAREVLVSASSSLRLR